ncbi:hypothetical protein D0Z00_002428 [Geotrichum galactomycetum]|uniref:Uncharacterized protein n=1 Tax=Geotrichum galactomycetum TaxID=27317 RepID=A0ACB6V425_9ASCO|nr:hypothetical protein D0Z00_002428 [Geotrichum candidum]
MDSSDSQSIVPLTNILNELVQLKYFLLTGPAQLRTENGIHRHTLPNKEQISCVVWRNVYFITGTDIVRCLSFRFEAFGREISNRKKFEEGIFSDLRHLKCDSDAVLEQPKSEFLDYLYRNNCVRTQKKQKIFYWFSVNHDRLFQDALERDLKKELTGKKSSTTPIRDPALSFQYDGSRTLHDQLPDIIEKFPRPLADLADASSVMSNLPIMSGQMMQMPQFAAAAQPIPYQIMPTEVYQPDMLYPQHPPPPPLVSEVLIPPQQPQPQPQQPNAFYYPPEPVALTTDYTVDSQQPAQASDPHQSDFPLDYVEPNSNIIYVTQQPDTTYYYDEAQYAPAFASDAITYDNQQFHVVYQQDSAGDIVSTMVPTTPGLDLPKKSPKRAPPRGEFGKPELHRAVSSTALQPRKLNAKISKPALKTKPSRSLAAAQFDYSSSTSNSLSAAYFMPTPSDSGCSDVTAFGLADPDYPDAFSPAVTTAGFRRPGPLLRGGEHYHNQKKTVSKPDPDDYPDAYATTYNYDEPDRYAWL